MVFSVRAEGCQLDPRARAAGARVQLPALRADGATDPPSSGFPPSLIYPAPRTRYINLNDVKGYIQLFLLCGLDKDTEIWQGSI